ncbi:MAG: response regulator [Gammaproteobacteria bacterium]|nr:response regulator [Gammaproteobacteria bacterium]
MAVEINHRHFVNQLMDLITGLVYVIDENHVLQYYNEKFSQVFDIEHLSDFTHEIDEKLKEVLNLSEKELENFKIDDNVAIFSNQLKTHYMKINSNHPGVAEYYKCVRYPILDGTTRYLVVQMIEASGDETLPRGKSASQSPTTSQSLPKILLVDPEEVSRTVIKSYFEELEGAIVECACSETAALEMFERGEYCLIVTEADLADSPGFHLSKEIRKREKGGLSHIPIVVITTHKLEDISYTYKKEGADGVLSKKINPEKARQLFDYYIKGKETIIPGLIKLSDIDFSA